MKFQTEAKIAYILNLVVVWIQETQRTRQINRSSHKNEHADNQANERTNHHKQYDEENHQTFSK